MEGVYKLGGLCTRGGLTPSGINWDGINHVAMITPQPPVRPEAIPGFQVYGMDIQLVKKTPLLACLRVPRVLVGSGMSSVNKPGPPPEKKPLSNKNHFCVEFNKYSCKGVFMCTVGQTNRGGGRIWSYIKKN